MRVKKSSKTEQETTHHLKSSVKTSYNILFGALNYFVVVSFSLKCLQDFLKYT